jgi:hypothetical protein
MRIPAAAWLIVPALALVVLNGYLQAEPEKADDSTPPTYLLVDPDDINAAKVAAWKEEGFKAVVLTLDERHEPATYVAAFEAITANGFDLYYWIEVGRNPGFASEHPEWIASLGSHDDWRKQFPKAPQLKKGEVAKAWPWTPIAYRDAFDAHIKRIETLLDSVPPGYRGVLLNDLQGGPSSCGCGNLQCRWAIDYGVPATTKKLDGHNIAARFIAQVESLASGKEVIPVWTTECEAHDIALEKPRAPVWSTGYCGSVDCLDYCFARFAEQWNTLHASKRGPVALLALHKEFRRNGAEYGLPGAWAEHVVKYIDQKELKSVPRGKIWLVVQGFDLDPDEEKAARAAAAKAGAGAVLVARTRIDQSYEPRVMSGISAGPSDEAAENRSP